MTKHVDLVPDDTALNKALYLALTRTYLRALIENSPFKTAETGNEWELSNPKPFQFEFVNRNGFLVHVFEEGMKEQIIRPKRKGGYLKFLKPARKRVSPYRHIPGNRTFVKGGYIYTQAVRHPGFVARHFIRQTFEDESLDMAFQTELQKLLLK